MNAYILAAILVGLAVTFFLRALPFLLFSGKREMPAWLRTLLCAMVNVFAYEVINVAYIYLGGTSLTATHFLRAMLDVLLTGLLTLLIEFPLRRLILGRREKPIALKNQPIVFEKK